MCARSDQGLVVAGKGHGDEPHGNGARFGYLEVLISLLVHLMDVGVLGQVPFFAIVKVWVVGSLGRCRNLELEVGVRYFLFRPCL